MMTVTSVVVSCARTVWPFVLEQLNKDSKSFRRALKSFIKLAFHSSVLLCCHETEVVMQQEVMCLDFICEKCLISRERERASKFQREFCMGCKLWWNFVRRQCA